MSETRSRSEDKKKIIVLKSCSNPSIKRARAEQLQKELDSLALLLEQVKKQADKVGAAADALGEAVIGNLDLGATAHHLRHGRRKTDSPPVTMGLKETAAWPWRTRSSEMQQA